MSSDSPSFSTPGLDAGRSGSSEGVSARSVGALLGTVPAMLPDTRPIEVLASTAARDALGSEELGLADRVARRMHAELTALLAALPADARNASGLARRLDIDRTTCQRAVFVATRPYEDAALLGRLPGIKALQQLAESAGRVLQPDALEGLVGPATSPHPAVAGLLAAIEQLQELIALCGGSQSRLARRIESSRHRGPFEAAGGDGATSNDPQRAARARLFEAAAALTGRSSACWVAVYVYRPIGGAAELVEVLRAHGLIGHVARADAVPLTLHNFTAKSSDGQGPRPGQFVPLVEEKDDGRSLDSLLREFSSDPAPLVRSRQPNEFLVQSIDERVSTMGRPVDFMLGTRSAIPNPLRQKPAIEEAWALINFPCRHLLFDIYLDRDLARRCIPSLDTHLWRPDFAQQVGDRWQTRFADSPSLQLLGAGVRSTPTPAYPRMSALTRTLFNRAELDPNDFVGFRCEVSYPIWRAGYCVSFDFSTPEPGSME